VVDGCYLLAKTNNHQPITINQKPLTKNQNIMLKFIKGHMESMEGIEIYPIISLLIFFSFFVILFWWVFTAKKDYIKTVSNIPLDNQNDTVL
jgi:cytochrome c oxidase cbb3-type subunit IV